MSLSCSSFSSLVSFCHHHKIKSSKANTYLEWLDSKRKCVTCLHLPLEMLYYVRYTIHRALHHLYRNLCFLMKRACHIALSSDQSQHLASFGSHLIAKLLATVLQEGREVMTACC